MAKRAYLQVEQPFPRSTFTKSASLDSRTHGEQTEQMHSTSSNRFVGRVRTSVCQGLNDVVLTDEITIHV